MGGHMAQRLREGGHAVVGYDSSPQSDRDVDSMEALVKALSSPRGVGDGSGR